MNYPYHSELNYGTANLSVGEEQAKDDATNAFACEAGPTRALLSSRPYQPNQSLSHVEQFIVRN
jgi:hypothetical protein